MDLGITGKRALVFASSDGIGKGIAQELVHEGARVVVTSRSEEKLKGVVSEIGAESFLVGDLAKPGEGARLVQQARETLGGLDILVTNAGGPPAGTFADISTEGWQTGFQSLFLSITESLDAALPLMIEQKWGRVIFITSTAGKEPIPSLTVSNALRAGIHGLMKSVCKEVIEHGITVNSILPGFTATDRLKEFGSSFEELADLVPAKRLGTTEELGKFVAYLCSAHSGFITGQAIASDGGRMQGL